MRLSTDRILTSQAGSLPRPDDLIEANRAREAGDTTDEPAFQRKLRAAVADVVRRQQDIGIDIPGDGEFGKSMGSRVNYGAWWSYCFNRLGGLDLASGPGLYDQPVRRSRPGHIVLTSMSDRRDRHSLRRGLCRSGRSGEHRPAQGALAGLRRPDHLQRPRRNQSRHRQLQGGACGGRHRGRFHDLDRAGKRGADRQRILQDRRRVPVRLRRGDARGIQGHRRCRLDPSARRSGDRRELGHDQSGAFGGGLPEILHGAGRGAQSRDTRPAGRSHPLPFVLGQLARPAHDRHSDARHRRRHAGGQMPGLIRSKPATFATSTNGRSGKT